MSLFAEYELVELIHDGPTKTFRARQTSTGSEVFIHLINDADPRSQQLLDRLRAEIRDWPPGETPVRQVGDSSGSAYVVTDVLEDFVRFEDWWESRPATVPPDRDAWRNRISERLQAALYTEAAELADRAAKRYPDDQELRQLADGIGIYCRGLDLLHAGNHAEALDRMREGERVSGGEPFLRQGLAAALFDTAQQLANEDPAASAELLEEVLQLEPRHRTARSLLQRSQKQQDFPAWCVQQASALREKGDLAGARAMAEEGRRRHPEDSRIQELCAGLGLSATKPAQPSEPTAEPPSEAAGATAVMSRPPPSRVEPRSAPRSAEAAQQPVEAPRAAPPTKKTGGPGPLQQFWSKLTAGAGAKGSGTKPNRWKRVLAAGQRRPLLSSALGAAVALIVIAIVHAFTTEPEPPPPVATVFPVEISAEPPGAEIRVAGKVCGQSRCTVELEPGTHIVQAQLAGFRTATFSLELDEAGAAAQTPVALSLEPLPVSVQIASDLERGEVSIDGEAMGELQEGNFETELEPREDREYLLEVTSGRRRTRIPLIAAPGRKPRVAGRIETRDLKVAAVASFGDGAVVYGDSPIKAGTLDGLDEAAPETEDSTELNFLTLDPGAHELELKTAKGDQRLFFDVNDEPALAVNLLSDRNVGGLRVVTEVDDSTVLINGRPQRRRTTRGRAVLWLVPSTYTVSVEKEGYEASPSQEVRIQKGEMAHVEFRLSPEPQNATLRISNGVPGAEVLLDGRSLGRIGGDGSFVWEQVTPGSHTVTLREASHRTREIQREFAHSQKVEMDGRLENAMGRLAIQVQPPAAEPRLTLRAEGASSERPVENRRLRLREGMYHVKATAEGYQDYVATVRVEAGEEKAATLVLQPIEKTRVERTLAEWEETGDWRRQGEMLVRQGGDFVLAPGKAEYGTYQFTVWLQRGKRIEWAVHFRDEANHLLFQWDKKRFQRYTVIDGDRDRVLRLNSPTGIDGFVSVRILVRPGAVVHQVRINDQWRVVDQWKDPPDRLEPGRFAFHIRGGDQLALSQFSFVPAD